MHSNKKSKEVQQGEHLRVEINHFWEKYIQISISSVTLSRQFCVL
jgi:hypothetical protein